MTILSISVGASLFVGGMLLLLAFWGVVSMFENAHEISEKGEELEVEKELERFPPKKET